MNFSKPAISKKFSPAASDLVDRFALLTADAKELSSEEELRLLAAMQRQIAARISDLIG